MARTEGPSDCPQGAKIRRLREEKGWTVEVAAKIAGLSSPTWRRAEDDHPVGHDALKRIAEALGEPSWRSITRPEEVSARSFAQRYYLGALDECVGTPPDQRKSEALSSIPRSIGYDDLPRLAHRCLAAVWRPEWTSARLHERFAELASRTAGSGRPASLVGLLASLTDRIAPGSPTIMQEVSKDDSLAVQIMLQRHYVNVGDCTEAARIESLLIEASGKDPESFGRHLVELRRGRRLFEKGDIVEARRIFFDNRSYLLPETDPLGVVMSGEFWQVGTSLLWSMTEVLCDNKRTKADQVVLDCLDSAVSNDFSDSVLYSISLLGAILQRDRQYAHAYNLYCDLWDTAVYLENVLALSISCCGLSECALWEGRDDDAVCRCFEIALAETAQMPGRRCELLAARAFHRVLTGDDEGAEEDAQAALKISEEQGLGLYRIKIEGVLCLVKAARKGVWKDIIDIREQDDKAGEEAKAGRQLLQGLNLARIRQLLKKTRVVAKVPELIRYLNSITEMKMNGNLLEWKFVHGQEMLSGHREVYG